MTPESIAVALCFNLACAIACGRIASGKNRHVFGFAILGFLCPLIGMIVALAAKPVEIDYEAWA